MLYVDAKRVIFSFSKVLVTGPHRAGTRVAARIVSFDFGLQYVDEFVVGFDNGDLIRSFLGRGNCVVHSPTFLDRAFELPGDVLVVVMSRDPGEIRASELRLYELQPKGVGVDWRVNTYVDRERYRRWGDLLDLDQHASVVKYEFYEKVFKPRASCEFLLLDYESLSSHELWVEKSGRAGFRWNQIS